MDRYELRCAIYAYDKEYLPMPDDTHSGVGRLMHQLPHRWFSMYSYHFYKYLKHLNQLLYYSQKYYVCLPNI